METVIIYDSNHPGAFRNRCFEESYATEGPGHSFTVELAKQAKLRGFSIMTSDIFLKHANLSKSIRAFCITDMVSKCTDALLQKGSIPLLCFSFESPIIARNFYLRINALAGRFIYSMQFEGTRDELKKSKTIFLPMYFPVDSREVLPLIDWGKRKFLVLINRNKRAFFNDFSSVKGCVRSVLSRVKLSVQRILSSWARSKEIYKDRIEAINYFSEKEGFELYGGGWNDKIPGFPSSYHRAALKVNKGIIGPTAKLIVMNQFRFAVCFENCSFPGYVTEKIFDCFLAGCIPIYFGAPDIANFVPADSFIDYRRFENFDQLYSFLSKMSDQEATKMLESARAFLASKDFDKFYTENVVSNILDLVETKITNQND